jgi:hypothetical protein
MKKIIVAVAALALMAGSAYAAEWNFYGSARVSTFWTNTDTDNETGHQNDDTQFAEGLQSNARIGAKVKVSDELTGRFEYGTSDDAANIRLLYGEWNFGAGKLLVGQDYVPMNLGGSNQVYGGDGDLQGWGGEMFGDRLAQIKLTFGDFQIAFIENDNSYSDGTANKVKEDEDNINVVIPMIQVQYALSGHNWKVTMAGGYQTFDVDDGTVDDDITSWGLGVDATATFGAFYVSGQVNGGTNVGNLWLIDVTGFDTDENALGAGYAVVTTGGDVIDNDAIGGRICVGYTFNEMFAVEVGYGYQRTEYDEDIAALGTDELESQSYYINFPITLAPGVVVTPEVGVVDFTVDDSSLEQDEITYFGAKWQIDF